MKDIKVKETIKNTIKELDRTVVTTEKTKDNLVYVKRKAESTNSAGETNANEYALNRINRTSKRTVEEIPSATRTGVKSIKDTKNNIIKTKDGIRNIKTKIKEKQELKKIRKGIKTSDTIIKNEVKKAPKRAFTTAQRAKRLIGNTYKGIKATVKATIKTVKAIIAAAKALISLLIAGGSIAVMVIIVICLVGLLIASIFGIFFSSFKVGIQPKTMNECVVDLNNDMNKKISDIENQFVHDEVIINSDRADWKDIIAVYSVKVNGGDNQDEVMSLDIRKQRILSEVFWDMNEVTFETKNEVYKSQSIGTWDKRDFAISSPSNHNTQFGEAPEEETEENKIVLYITITSKTVEDMKEKYAFNEAQLNQLEEITSEDKIALWNSVIYGVYGDSGEYTTWKQRGREWSNITIGTTRSTIGDIGCLVTSVSMLIAKSGVDVPNISDFNPGTFVTALNYNYGFDAGGNLQYGAISKVVPNFTYVGRVNLRGMTKEQKLTEIKNYYNRGYYLATEVLGARVNSQHWVAVDNVTDTTVLMLDPSTEAKDMWQQYDWNNTTQFVYFKATKEG